ncbi:MAG: hypothetical protein IJJ33_12680 [Victivallales bacterium]|nr:hypothetical protein [Victivallales bacterium]
MMNIAKTAVVVFTVYASALAFGLSDSDFELTNPGELPLWSGSQWVKTSKAVFSAKVIENEKEAASGKRFLRVANPQKGSVYVIGLPTQKRIPGYGFLIRAKARGTALANVTITPFNADRKPVPWKATHETGFKKMESGKWHQFELKYIPLEGEEKFQIGISVRDGQVDYDAFEVRLIEVGKAENGIKDLEHPKRTAEPPAVKKQRKSVDGKYRLEFGFETWMHGIPIGWTREENDAGTIVRPVINGQNEIEQFGERSLFLDGRMYMEPPLNGLGDKRKRPIRFSFYAKGDCGRIKANLREGRDGFVDYLVELIEEETSAEWKKYATELTTPGGRVDNISLEFIGKNVVVDNVEIEALQSNTGKMNLSIPIVKKAPVIDGVNSPGEWDFAAGGSDPFRQSVASGALGKSPALQRQGSVKLCSDGNKLYMLVESFGIRDLKANCVNRDDPVYTDDCVEVHFNPEFGNHSPKTSYQFVFNGKNTVFDQKRSRGTQNRDAFSKWNAKSLESRSVVKDGVWTLEMGVDLEEVEVVPGKEFGFNICYTRFNPDEGGTMNGYGYLDLENMIRTIVSKDNPAMYWNRNGDWGSLLVSLSSDFAPAGDYRLNFKIDSEKAREEQKRTVYLAPGRCVPVLFHVKEGAGNFGSFALELKKADGSLISNQIMDFNTVFFMERKAERTLEFHLLPEQKKYALNVFLKTGKFQDLDKVTVTGLDRGVISYGKSDFTNFDGVLVVKNDFVPVDGKDYEICVQALNGRGEILETANKHFKAEQSLIPSETPGLYEEIFPPYTAIDVKGNTAKVNLRDYVFAGNGLPEQVIAVGEKVLNAPIRLTALDENGNTLAGKNGTFRIVSAKPEKLVFAGETLFPGFTVKLTGEMEYDGAIFYRAEMQASSPVKIRKLTMETPFRDLSLLQAFIDSQLWLWMCRQPAEGEYRHPSVKVWTSETIMYPQGYRRFSLFFFPKGDGLLFSSRKIIPGVIKNGFMPYMTFGNFKYGMEIFADCDRGWVHAKGSAAQEIFRRGGEEIVCTNFVSALFELNGSRTFEFGILATPAKKIVRDRRFEKIFINGYSHTGLTDQALAGLRIKDWNLFDAQYKRFVDKGRYPVYLCCKGHFPQMDPVAKYMDSEWRSLPLYTFRDSVQSLPSQVFGKDQRRYLSPSGCYTPGRLNFYGERFHEIIKNAPNVQGVYWDENWFKPCNSPNHAECGYLLADGQVQGRSWWRGVREVDRRVRSIFRRYGRENPILDMFTGEGVIPHAYAFGSFNSYAEHLTYDMDFIDYWTPHFMEIGAAGAWGFHTGFFGMFRDPKYLPNRPMHRALLALVKLYNTHFNPDNFNQKFYQPLRNAEHRFDIYDPNVEFVGYFSEHGKKLNTGLPNTVKATFFIRPGKGALMYLSNLGENPFCDSVKFDLSGFGIKEFTAFNAEELTPLDMKQVNLPRHDFLCIELKSKQDALF